MPRSALRSFFDPDDCAAATRAGTVELAITAGGHFKAKLVRIDLHRLWMQRFSDNLPRIGEVSNLLQAASYITFRTQPGPRLVQGGVEIRSSAILRQGQVRDYHHRSAGSATLASMSMPVEDLAAVGKTLGGCELDRDFRRWHQPDDPGGRSP
jgi:hypothetical protein